MRLFTFLVLSTIFFNLNAQEFQKSNIELLGRWTVPPDKEAEYGTVFSSCYGYEQGGREYAIIGCGNGTIYVDITEPKNPVFSDFVPSRVKNATWREYKTYKNYAYQVSDDGGDNHFDIVDLSYLPDSVHVVYSGSKEYFKTGHTIFMDGSNMYIGLHNHTSMSVFSLKDDPTDPKFLRYLSDDYPGDVHDMFVRNDTVYASKGWDGALQILEFKNNKFIEIGNFSNYPFVGYNHSSWLTPDGKTLIFTDEVPGALPAKSLDVTDPANPVLVDTFYSQSGKATLHNPFEGFNNTFVMASYEDGVQVFDYSDPKEIKLRGFFDTHWQSDAAGSTGGYSGTWSVYTPLPSKNMIAVDRQNGLFVLDASQAYYPEVSKNKNLKDAVKLVSFPNPSTDNFRLQIPEHIDGSAEVKIYNNGGKLVYQNIFDVTRLKNHSFATRNWASGLYFVQLNNNGKYYISEQAIR